MQDCFIQQSIFAAREKDKDEFGFNRVRSSVASHLMRIKDHGLSGVGEAHLQDLKKKRMDREEREIFSNRE